MLQFSIRRAVALGVVGSAAFLAACSGGGGGGGTTVNAVKGGFAYQPANLTLDANKPVVVTLKNPDAVIHDWVIPDKNIKIEAAPGKDATGTVNLPAGTYKIVCTQPGHEAAGMVGQLTVR